MFNIFRKRKDKQKLKEEKIAAILLDKFNQYLSPYRTCLYDDESYTIEFSANTIKLFEDDFFGIENTHYCLVINNRTFIDINEGTVYDGCCRCYKKMTSKNFEDFQLVMINIDIIFEEMASKLKPICDKLKEERKQLIETSLNSMQLDSDTRNSILNFFSKIE